MFNVTVHQQGGEFTPHRQCSWQSLSGPVPLLVFAFCQTASFLGNKDIYLAVAGRLLSHRLDRRTCVDPGVEEVPFHRFVEELPSLVSV